jgi:hypothetical protein
MNSKRVLNMLALLVLLVSLLPAAVTATAPEPTSEPLNSAGAAPAEPAEPAKPARPEGSGIESLSGSFVAFDPSVGGAPCFITGATQTFCFEAHSFTNDWEYVYDLWTLFPADWTVLDVYVEGTPVCSSGTWGSFSWAYGSGAYEVDIYHPRYQATTDDCVAYYCFEVDSGTGSPDALESWYWDGDGYGGTPHWPCSDDQYTPSGWPTCDEWVNPQAAIPECQPGLYLAPDEINVEGCADLPQTHTFNLWNNTGADGTFDLAYDVPSGNATLTGPDQIYLDDGDGQDFDVELTPDACLPEGTQVVATIDASGNGYSDDSTINKTILGEIAGWASVPNSAPGWAGFAYPVDGCAAMNAAGEWVTYIIGDQSGIAGFWGYNHNTNTWFQPAGAAPADRWAPDWAYDEETNLCYMTGGANAPGGGTYNETWQYDPAADTWTQLPNFTSIRDFHNSWVGTLNGTRYLCIGGGVNASSVMQQSTQCYDIAGGAWNAENADMDAYPTDPFGAADATLHADTGDQFWFAGGAINAAANVTDEVWAWDDADDSWHSLGNTGAPRYRVEADFKHGDFYQLGGSSGGFTHTPTTIRGVYDAGTWVFTQLDDMPLSRMDNIAVMIPSDTMWSVDGYGASDIDYVAWLIQCPPCQERGMLDGYVMDAETGDMYPPCTNAVVHVEPGDLDLPVDPTTGYFGPTELFSGTYTIDATAPGYSLETIVADVSTDMTTTVDFSLERPVIDVDPDAIEVDVLIDDEETFPLTISNLGGLPLDFEILEVPSSPAIASAEMQFSEEIFVEPQIQDEMAEDETTGYLIYFRERPDLSAAYSMEWIERGRFVANALQEAAAHSQAQVRAYLDAQGADYAAFWGGNIISVHSSNRATFDGLLAFPEIGAILAHRSPILYEPEEIEPADGPMAIEPNISHVNADQVWAMGYTGEGIVVANIDTGVNYGHATLVDHYRGNLGGGSFDHNYNWWDPALGDQQDYPNDWHDHGSNTMGIMLGDDGGANQIGMAPGAQWIACQAFEVSDDELLECGEFMLAPWDLTGANPDSDMRPHVVNNSWGDCLQYADHWYDGIVADWHAAGIYPVFSNGNAGNCGYSYPPGCNTVGNPARAGNVTGVGSTGTFDGQYATHSNWGPTDDPDTVNPSGYPDLKPQVMAPGVSIRSAGNTGDEYVYMTGTSQSAPHVSGLIALMWSAAPCLIGDYATTETIIETTAVPIAYASGCGGEGPGNIPNYATGWGEIDALAAVEAAMEQCPAADIPWVWTDPVSGTIPGDDDLEVSVTFACTMEVDLEGTLLIQHNDPCQDDIEVPLLVHCVEAMPYYLPIILLNYEE